MRFFKCYAVLLIIILAQTIAGCGGGGGSTGTVVVIPPITDTTPPTVNFFTMPATSTSLTVAISNLSATDAVGVTGYLVTESAVAPSASATGWSSTAPTSFNFSATGSRIAYAWAKDAAGNVSMSRSASVTISTTKTVTLKFYSQSTNSSDLIGGFNLTVILPVGSVIPTEIITDSSGASVVVPLSNAVFLSGKFQNAAQLSSNTMVYNSTLRELKINYPTANEYELGEFITILITVPSSYMPNMSDINITLFKAFAPLTGADMPSVTATSTFN